MENVVLFISNFKKKIKPEENIPENQNKCTQQTIKRK